MSTWAGKRRLIYGAIFIVAAVLIVGVPAFVFLYEPASCNDDKLNGDETGIDCGGTCPRMCQADFLPPLVSWSRYEEVAPGLFNAATYIINQNPAGEAKQVPYHMALYDAAGMLIADREGMVTLPPHRNTLAFTGAIPVGNRRPAKAFFEFKAVPQWTKRTDTLDKLTFDSGAYRETDSGSSLIVNLGNPTQEKISGIAVYAVLKDGNGNAIGFSRTYIDEIPAKGSATAPFTWPSSRMGQVVSHEILPVLE